MYSLVSENLTGLGGPMGTDRTWTNWQKFFTDMKSAKTFAERDYAKHAKHGISQKINWSMGNKACNSGDLGFVMYYISEVKTEDTLPSEVE